MINKNVDMHGYVRLNAIITKVFGGTEFQVAILDEQNKQRIAPNGMPYLMHARLMGKVQRRRVRVLLHDIVTCEYLPSELRTALESASAKNTNILDITLHISGKK